MEEYLIGFDIGTLSSKAVLTDKKGNIISKFQSEHAIEVAHPGWQEESMEMWWGEFKEAVHSFLNSGIPAEAIKAIGVTGLIPAMCPIDEEGNVLRNAILHTDVRAEKELQFAQEHVDAGISHGHMLPKVLWVKEQEEELYQKVHKVMVPHGFIAYRLTGTASIDYDAASMIGGLFDEEALGWKKEQILASGIRPEILPDPVPATKVLGNVSEKAAKETGLSVETKVIAGVGDTFASILGGGVYNAKHLMLYLGTSATVIYTEESPKNYTDIPHYGEKKGHFVGRILSFGESIMHLRNCLRYDAWEPLNRHLNEIEPGSEGLWYLPHYKLQTDQTYFGSDAEYMLGFRGRHTQYHMYHAMLEGIAYNARYNVENFHYLIEQINIFGGGANSREIIQIFADILGRKLHYNPKSSTALGIAFLAGYGSGVIEEFEQLGDVWFGDSQVIEPDPEHVEQYNVLYKRYQELRKAMETLDSSFV